MIPNILNSIVKYIIDNPLTFSSASKDGRVNSITDENTIIDTLKLKFNVEAGDVRSWYDMLVRDGDNIFYINIKCTSLLKNNADNVSSIDGILYSLTGKIPTKINSWKKRFEFLSCNMKDTIADYYFLVVGKDDINKSYVTSVKSLFSIIPNGNNLPFQCKWSDNNVLIDRNFEESVDFILNCIKTSLKLRANAYFEYCDILENKV